MPWEVISFCFAMKGDVFALKGDLQFLSIMKDKRCDFFVSLENTKYNEKQEKEI